MNNIPTTIFKDDVFRNLCHHWQEEKRCPLIFIDHFEENETLYPNAYKALKWAADGYRLKKKDNETLEWVYPCPQIFKTSSMVTKIRIPNAKTLKRRKKRKSSNKGVIQEGTEFVDVNLYTVSSIRDSIEHSRISRVFPLDNNAMGQGVESMYLHFGSIQFCSFEAAIYTYLQYFDENEIPKLTQMKVQDHPQMGGIRFRNSWGNPG
jgi:hypothetical protein